MDFDKYIQQQSLELQDTEDLESKQELEALQQEYSVEDEAEKEHSDEKIIMEDPFNPQDIDIKTKTMSLDNIIKRLRENEIDMAPDFQRQGNLWPIEKQSQLIESVLIKLPLPAFYFDGSNDNKWLVVDGLQRLSAIKNFVVDKSMALYGLEFLKKLDGFKFDDLPRAYQRQIEEAEIMAYIINPGTPEDVKFNIFKRINTGGLVLAAQEIRHALNQGTPAKFVAELANLQEFKRATGWVIATDRMLDREFVTRFITFYINSPADYKPDLDTFMSRSMGQLKYKTERELLAIKNNFIEAMKLSSAIFSRWAFRKVYNITARRKPINKALFEVWSVELAKLSDEERKLALKRKKAIFNGFVKLMNEDVFFGNAITSATGDKSRVRYRFSKIEELLKQQLI
ncbi:MULTISPECIES: DUF262 domain-containing protein [Bacteroides]|uniref:DUF262 domain-containing protein n=1 Tax=Bacteroides TaxID=816 RepID=UPI00095CE468|nr:MULTISPECIES: DUF262 domain-containing protein [Bacteroides]OKY99329.1 MAG: hypothetical protein BHV73_09515 [Bacteroides sp. 44_46]